MYKIIYSLIVIIIISYGCDSNEPIIEDTSDEVTITHNKNGFSFLYGKAISVPNSENIIPDIIILAHLDEQRNVLGVFFAADSLRQAFNLVREFSNFDSARTFFNNLAEVPDSNYQDLALPVSANQVWAVKTNDNKYGKILIMNTKAYEYSPAPGFRGYYLEAKFKWKYQPNGSRYF
jgi:hypothetical protein